MKSIEIDNVIVATLAMIGVEGSALCLNIAGRHWNEYHYLISISGAGLSLQ